MELFISFFLLDVHYGVHLASDLGGGHPGRLADSLLHGDVEDTVSRHRSRLLSRLLRNLANVLSAHQLLHCPHVGAGVSKLMTFLKSEMLSFSSGQKGQKHRSNIFE